MYRHVAGLMLLLLLTSCAPAMVGSQTYLGFSIGIESAPPPPAIVFAEGPATELVPGTQVYVVGNTDYDAFQCGGYWYVVSEGYWYRASSYSGPYAVVDVRRVPRQILTLPSERWKHGPPGEHRGWDRGNRGRGHGRGDDDQQRRGDNGGGRW